MRQMALLLCAIVAFPINAHGQLNESFDDETIELMGRLCVNEASFRTRDCVAITHIRMRSARSHDRTLKQELIALHGRRSLRPDRASNPSRRDNRAWIGDLHIVNAVPRHWPDGVDWETQGRPAWANIIGAVNDVLSGRAPNVCNGSPNTWGNRTTDHARALRLGFRQVDCGNTANMYWRM